MGKGISLFSIHEECYIIFKNRLAKQNNCYQRIVNFVVIYLENAVFVPPQVVVKAQQIITKFILGESPPK